MERLLDFFKACSDAIRLRLLVLLAQKDFCVCELVAVTGLSQPKISKHLATLKSMGLLTTRKEERYTYYTLAITDAIQRALLDDILKNYTAYEPLKRDAERITDGETLRMRYRNQYT